MPQLRWSRPKYTPRRGLVPDTRRVRPYKSKVPPRNRIERLGKIRGAVVDALEVAGGTLNLQELCKVLHRKRARDVKRRILPVLEEAGIIAIEDDVVALTGDWFGRLQDARQTGGELEADELAERWRKLNSRAYHRRHETPVSKPSAAGLAAVKRSHEQRRAGLAAMAERAAAATKTEEQFRAEAFVRDQLRKLGRIRLGLLQDCWRDEGGDALTIPLAVEALGYRVERLAEFENGRFVFAPSEAEGAA